MNPSRWHQVTELFHAALSLHPDTRDAFIAEACKDDPALGEDVARLIAAHDAAAGLPGVRALSMTGDSDRLEPGRLLGPYLIEAWIGAGGMGEVYRALDTRLGRAVALKTL